VRLAVPSSSFRWSKDEALMGADGIRGKRVIDMTEGVAGPYATSLLGDMGADVIKVERPAGDWGRTAGPGDRGGLRPHFVALNRNKRAVGLDLRRPGAQEVMRRLVERADVVVSNFRPGVMEGLGLSHRECAAVNPGLIYCAISAFGQEGTYSRRPGSDTILQAVSGIMDVTGDADGPPLRVSFSLIDMAAALFAVQGVLLALYERDTTRNGTGRRVDVSLLDAGLALQAAPFTDFFADGRLPGRHGNQNPALSPAGAFRTSDGKYLTVAVLREAHWEKFCSAISRPDLVADPRFSDNRRRLAGRAQLNEILDDVFRARTQSEWLDVLGRADVLCAPVNSYRDVVADSGLGEAMSTVRFELPDGPMTTIGNPVLMDGRRFEVTRCPPELGAHTVDVLSELGYTADEIESLRRSEVGIQAMGRGGVS
jgi:crotonobetainyl-CoA:carnitine CoA-transferase CaiB-like acyl-CoA transferase